MDRFPLLKKKKFNIVVFGKKAKTTNMKTTTCKKQNRNKISNFNFFSVKY